MRITIDLDKCRNLLAALTTLITVIAALWVATVAGMDSRVQEGLRRELGPGSMFAKEQERSKTDTSELKTGLDVLRNDIGWLKDNIRVLVEDRRSPR